MNPRKYAQRIKHWIIRDMLYYMSGVDIRKPSDSDFITYIDIYNENDMKEMVERLKTDLEEVVEASRYSLPYRSLEIVVDGVKQLIDMYLDYEIKDPERREIMRTIFTEEMKKFMNEMRSILEW